MGFASCIYSKQERLFMLNTDVDMDWRENSGLCSCSSFSLPMMVRHATAGLSYRRYAGWSAARWCCTSRIGARRAQVSPPGPSDDRSAASTCLPNNRAKAPDCCSVRSDSGGGGNDSRQAGRQKAPSFIILVPVAACSPFPCWLDLARTMAHRLSCDA